jgi:glycogen synthase
VPGCLAPPGIMNGIDIDEWDPANDRLLPPELRYDRASAVEGKAAAKAALQQHCGLALDPEAALVAFIGRLTDQKGVDVLLSAVPSLLGGAAGGAGKPQLVMLGTGEAWMERALMGLSVSHPGRGAGIVVRPHLRPTLSHLPRARASRLRDDRRGAAGHAPQCAGDLAQLPVL